MFGIVVLSLSALTMEEACSDAPDRNQTETEELIAELCIMTDNENLKTALKKYQHGLTIKAFTNKLLKGAGSSKDDLDKLLEFLNQGVVTSPLHPKTTRPYTAHAIARRIQNLLPHTCHMCNVRYKLEIQEIPCLPCSKCGQSSHKQCIVQFLACKTDVSYNSMELSNDDILKLLNPLNFSGLHFLCDPCEKEVVAGGKEPEERIQSSQSTQPHQSLPEGPSADANIDSGDQTIATAEEANRDPADPACSSAKNPTNQQENANSDNPDRNDSLKKITCKFYKKGSCRHGLLGGECKFNHPAMCKKYTQHGSRQPRGCNKGKDCQFFHPQMCINSLRSGKCLSQHCRYRHIKGTVRHNDAGEINSNRVPEKPMEDKTKTKKADAATKQATSHQKQSKDANPFLEEFRLLKAELLQAMDTKVRIAIQSLQPQQQVQFLNKPQQQTQIPNQNPSHQFPQMIQAYHQQNPIQFQHTPVVHPATIQSQLVRQTQDAPQQQIKAPVNALGPYLAEPGQNQMPINLSQQQPSPMF